MIKNVIKIIACVVVIGAFLGACFYHIDKDTDKKITEYMEASTVRVASRINTATDVLLLNRFALMKIRQSLHKDDPGAAVSYCNYTIALHKEIRKTESFDGIFISFVAFTESLRERIRDSNKIEYPHLIQILDECIEICDDILKEIKEEKTITKAMWI